MMSILYNWHTTFFLLLLANSPDGCLLCNCEFKLEVLSMFPHRRYFMHETGRCQEKLTIGKDVLAQECERERMCNSSRGQFSISVFSLPLQYHHIYMVSNLLMQYC